MKRLIAVFITIAALTLSTADLCIGRSVIIWKDAVIEYEGTIVSSQGEPQQNIKLICGQDKPLAISDENGKIAFTLKTRIAQSCQPECGMLTFVKETPSSFESYELAAPWCEKTSYKEEKFTLDQPYQKGEMKEGKLNGLWQEWCTSIWHLKRPQLSFSGNYTDGIKHGEWTEWHCGAGRKSFGAYDHGRKEGVWTEWYHDVDYTGRSLESYPDGKIRQLIDWHDGKMNGRWISWFMNGQLEAELTMRDDKRYGTQTYYSWDGDKFFTDSNGMKINNPDVK